MDNFPLIEIDAAFDRWLKTMDNYDGEKAANYWHDFVLQLTFNNKNFREREMKK